MEEKYKKIRMWKITCKERIDRGDKGFYTSC
jgi:hypothetical protein